MKRNEFNKGKDKSLWKFSSSLISNTDFVEQIKQLIENIKQQQLSESEQTDQIRWELLKYEMCKFAITYSKKISQNAGRSQWESSGNSLLIYSLNDLPFSNLLHQAKSLT